MSAASSLAATQTPCCGRLGPAACILSATQLSSCSFLGAGPARAHPRRRRLLPLPSLHARSARKLCLVLDLDHTLLNSVLYSELLGPQGKWLEARAAAQAQLPPERRDLYRLDSIKVPRQPATARALSAGR